MKKAVTLAAITMLIATTAQADIKGRFKFSDLFDRVAGGASLFDGDDDQRLGRYDDREDDWGVDDDDDDSGEGGHEYGDGGGDG
ncbi:hypothetical protein [Tateyamaria sp. syn59]|uniref:hypothetical protein n=1 Tax=Tateyamaria sp. syn59 TaxID=2576942 RepID=UPI0011BF4102|nr:hypothetical protein [Tateyamaria sp. syn59]